MQRLSLDTNVLISGLLFGGIPLAAIEAAQRYGELLVSAYLIEEFRAVLASRKFGWPKARIDKACELLFVDAVFVEPARILALTRDTKDDPILACALAGEADFLITGDEDLLVLKRCAGVKIITPKAFLALAANY